MFFALILFLNTLHSSFVVVQVTFELILIFPLTTFSGLSENDFGPLHASTHFTL